MNLSESDLINMITLVSAAVGAFLGSLSAFLLEAWRRKREENDTRYSTLFRTQLVLVTQLNIMLNITKHYLDEYRSDPQRFSNLIPNHTVIPDLRLDWGSLWFVPLIDNDGNLIHRVYLAEQAFVTATNTLALRNQKFEKIMYAEDVGVESFDFNSGKAQIQIDARKARLLKTVTDGLYESIDDAINQQEKVIRDLRALIIRTYPGRKSLKLEIQPANNASHLTDGPPQATSG